MPQENDIYKFMQANKLTDKDEKTFLNEYSNPKKAKELYSFFQANKLTDKDETLFYDTYLKKKEPALSVSSAGISPFQTGGELASGAALGKIPSQQKPISEPVKKQENQGWLLNTVSALDKGFYKNFIGNPVRGLGTLLEQGTAKITGGSGKGFISDALISFGDYFNKAIDEVTPQDEAYKNTLSDQFGQALGQVASLVATGGVGGGVSKGASIAGQAIPKAATTATAIKSIGSGLASPVAISSGLVMGQSEFDKAKSMGATDDQAFEAFYKNAAVGSILEKIPVMQFMKRFNQSTGGGVANFIKTKGVAGITGGLEEMTTEVLQQLYANKTAKDVYNVNQNIFEGVSESGGIGFGVGFLLNAMGANAKLLKKQGKVAEAKLIENQVKEFQNKSEGVPSSDNKSLATKIAVQGNEEGLLSSQKDLDRDLANGVITPEEHESGIAFAQKAAEVNNKIPETITGENRAKSIELIAERDRLEKEIQEREALKEGLDKAYYAPLDEANAEVQIRIDEINKEVGKIATKKQEHPIVEETITTEETPTLLEQDIKEQQLQGEPEQITQPIELSTEIKETPSIPIEKEYRGEHQIKNAPTTANDLEGGNTGFEWKYVKESHDLTDPATKQSFNILKSIKDNPDAEVTIYRSVPKGTDKINEGDWITLSKRYAKEHGEHPTDPSQDLPVIEMKVKAKDIGWDGNDLNEFVYNPKESKTSIPISKEEGHIEEFKKLSDADIEKRMSEIEDAKNGTPEKNEFNSLEKEMEKRERESIFNVPLDKVNESVDALIKKEKEKPNGYGSFIEKRDARETKEIANRYLKAKNLTDEELKKDFSDAIRGNPTTWYADGLKMRESLKEATNRGIDTKEMLAEAAKVYEDAGYDANTAKRVVANMIKPIFEGAKAEKINENKLLSETKEKVISNPTAEKTEPQKRYEEINNLKSEKVKSKEKAKFVDDHFESIVSQLMLKNKIKRICP